MSAASRLISTVFQFRYMLTISPRQATSGPKWAFGKVLREFREKKGMSQEQLADAAGLDRSFISLVERGIQSPNVVVLLKIADVLGAPAAGSNRVERAPSDRLAS